MTKENKFFIWMVLITIVLMLTHYLILWTLKNDEPFFFLLSFVTAAAAITSWIFDMIERRKKR